MTKERAKNYSISLFQEDLDIIDNADKYGAGRSATLRRIIREWAEWQPTVGIRERPTPYTTPEQS